jgi:hypothetical protein
MRRSWEEWQALLAQPVPRTFINEEPEPEPKPSARERAKRLGWRVVESRTQVERMAAR